jgi:hypothetical protein
MAAKEMMVVGLVRVRAKVEAHAAASPRPSAGAPDAAPGAAIQVRTPR